MTRSKRYHSYRYQVGKHTALNRPPVPVGFTVDHIVPVSAGFRWDIPAELVGSAENLAVVPFQENLSKGATIGPAAIRLLRSWGREDVASWYESKRAA